MQLLLIRHGQPDYRAVSARHFIGHGRDLAQLSDLGRQQAEAVALDPRLQDADIILSSPYTRALQTAAILSRYTGIPIEIETDLMEWMPDLTFTYSSPAHFGEIDQELRAHRGIWDSSCKYHWESLPDLGKRSFCAVKRYLDRNKVIAVTHGMVIRQFVYMDEVPCCQIIEYTLEQDSLWNGFVK